MADKFINLSNGIATIKTWVLGKIAGIANPSESIDFDANGKLTVGGRLGQFPNGGLYYPTSADPVTVGNYTLLMSEAKGLSAAHRELIIAGGSTVTLKTAAAAGATQYRISNTQNNRFICLGWVDGRLAVDEASAKEKTVAITSIKFANGNNISAYFGATESNNDIIITVAETLNPSGTLSGVRGYGTWKNADIVSAGQGNYVGGGKTLQVGQGLATANNVNQIGMIGIRQFNSGGNSMMVGSDNINKKNFSAIFGQGIDNSNGTEGLAAFGKWPVISSDTAFVVGNGTAYNARSNLFGNKVRSWETTRVAQTDDAVQAEAHTLDIPYQARMTALQDLRDSLYRDAMALDTDKISAGNITATAIQAAYENLTLKCDAYEMCVTDFIRGLLKLIGVDDSPVYKRSKLLNRAEDTQMVLSAAQYLDQQTILEKLPFINQDEIDDIMDRLVDEEAERYEEAEEPAEDLTAETEAIDGGMLEEYGNEVLTMLEELMEEM